MAPCCRCCWAGAPAPQGSPPSQMGPCKQRPHTLCGFWAAGPFGAFLAAPGPRFGRGPCPCRGPRRAAAPAGPVGPPVRPQRPSGPFRPLPGAGPPLLPPRSPARPCSPGPLPLLPAALAGPVCPGLAVAALRPSVGRPCFVSGAAFGQRVAPRGVRCGPAVAASGPAAPRGAPRRPVGRLFPLRGPRVGWLRGPACRALLRLSGGAVFGWGSPLRPPPAAPAGGSGGPRPEGAPPRLRRAPEGLPPRTPLRGAGPCRGGPRPAFSARFTFRKLSTMVPARRPSDHKRAVKAAHPAGLRSQRRRRCGARPGLDCPFSGNLPGGP